MDQDRTAFCLREYPRLVRVLSLQCGDRFMAEELAQEALIKACARWSQVQGLHNASAWVLRVGINLANSWLRRRAAERRALARHGAAPGEAEAAVDDELTLVIRAAVAELPSRQRAAVVLRFYAGLPVAEAAEVMGCAQGTVRAHTHHALAALRTALGDVVEVAEES